MKDYILSLLDRLSDKQKYSKMQAISEGNL